MGFLHSKFFNNIGIATFRKFVFRLAAEELLIPVGKSIYTIGEVNDLESVVISHYTSAFKGMPAGKFLFYTQGWAEKPEKKEIFSNIIRGGKTIGNVKVIQCDISFLAIQQFCVLFMESLKHKRTELQDRLEAKEIEKLIPALCNLHDFEIKSLIMNTNYSRQIYL